MAVLAEPGAELCVRGPHSGSRADPDHDEPGLARPGAPGRPPRPDLADNIYFRYYWESLQAIQRITEDGSGMAGFASLGFMDADVVFDGGFQGNAAGNMAMPGAGGSWSSGAGAPASHMYLLNTNYIFLRPHKERDMVPIEPDRFSINQDAMVKLIAWAGNMTMSNRELQAVITA